MKKIVRLTETDLNKIVRRVLKESKSQPYIKRIICRIMNPSYPRKMTKDEFDERYMDWGEIIVWGDGDIGDTDHNILLYFLCVDEEEYYDNEEEFVGDLNIDERFLDMVHTIDPNLSRSNIISIIKECFLDEYQKATKTNIVINSVRVFQL
jgi:hypothetical protein